MLKSDVATDFQGWGEDIDFKNTLMYTALKLSVQCGIHIKRTYF